MRNKSRKEDAQNTQINKMCSAQWVHVDHGKTKNMTRCTDMYSIFFGVEHRMRKVEQWGQVESL